MNSSKQHVGLAVAMMAVVISLNLAVSANLLAASDAGMALRLNSQNIYILAGLEMLLVLLAYLAAKHSPLPAPS